MNAAPSSKIEKWRNLTFLSAAELLAMGLWFSGSAVVPQLSAEWALSDRQQAWMTMSVQAGFVVGALSSAILNLADRFSSRRLVVACTLLGALCNGAIPVVDAGPAVTIALRFLTGAALAGVYPPGMKLVATWAKRDRGLAIGLLVGALSVGSALPHLLNAVPLLGGNGMPPWRPVLLVASSLAVVGALIVLFLVREGPHLGQAAPFDWRFAGRALTSRPIRLANLGYLGHMWELYAMWTWVPMFLLISYERAGWELRDARLAGFSVIAIGLVGCVLAGVLADRIGRTTAAIGSLVISGACSLVAGLFFHHPLPLTIVCLVWGFAVVADSAQFSAAVSELSDPRYVGTSLTMQTSLGFLLTLVTIQIIPRLATVLGWEKVFAILAIGPVGGVISMARLRRLPEALRMASGNR